MRGCVYINIHEYTHEYLYNTRYCISLHMVFSKIISRLKKNAHLSVDFVQLHIYVIFSSIDRSIGRVSG